MIEETGRNALTDVRRVLGALREDTPYAPTPGLDELPALAQQAAIAGVDIRLDVRQEEPAAAVPESVGLAVYRIMQEAVTNVVKRAAPATCRATMTVTHCEVRIEVTDDGRRPVLIGGEAPPPSAGWPVCGADGGATARAADISVPGTETSGLGPLLRRGRQGTRRPLVLVARTAGSGPNAQSQCGGRCSSNQASFPPVGSPQP